MNVRAVAVVIASLALSGCTTEAWDGASSVADYFGFGDSDEAPAADRPAAYETVVATTFPPPQTDRADTFCRGFADTEGWKSAQLGSGPELQKKIAEDAYRHCIDGSSDWID